MLLSVRRASRVRMEQRNMNRKSKQGPSWEEPLCYIKEEAWAFSGIHCRTVKRVIQEKGMSRYL